MPAQLSPIEANERTVKQIFDDAYAFEIPAYQRPYAWEIEQTKELLSDLVNAMDDKDASGGVYFLGSIVLIKSPSDPQSKVIDGQQRLTTLTILLSVLRDLTTDIEKRIGRREYIFQKANSDKGTSDRFRVLLREQDRAFFLKTVQRPDATNSIPDLSTLKGSQLRIAANTQYLREQLEVMDEGRRDSLIAFIIQRCYLVVVAVPTAESARRIFTVLNARGLDLTPTDILKADVLDRAVENQEGPLAGRWEAIEQSIGREEMVELFGHIRMIYEREKPRLALEASFAKAVEPFRGDADKFISEILEPLADAFTLLKDDKSVQQQFGAEAAKAVRSLFRIDNKDWVPPLLLKLWQRKPGEREQVSRFIVQLERVAFYLFVTRQGVNDRIIRFAKIMNEIDPREGKSQMGLTLDDFEQAEFIQELDGNIYQKGRVCKAVLQRLDEALSSGGASYDELGSIEHVLPQTVEAGSEWDSAFPDELSRAEWTHRLANLVLLTRGINSKASNWDFARKKSAYFSSDSGSSPFVITQEVLRTDKWDLPHLAERQQWLLTKLSAVWDLNLTKIQSQDVSEDLDLKDGKAFTDSDLVDGKRGNIINALASRLNDAFIKKSRASYINSNDSVRVVCTVSKRYLTNSPYWYGYHPRWDEFLSQSKDGFLVLGCMDRAVAYAIPHRRIAPVLKHLHKSTNRHWHIALDENELGELELVVPKNNSKISLKEFELKI